MIVVVKLGDPDLMVKAEVEDRHLGSVLSWTRDLAEALDFGSPDRAEAFVEARLAAGCLELEEGCAVVELALPPECRKRAIIENPDVGCAPHGAKRPCGICARNEASKRSRAGRRQRAAGQGPVTGNKPAGRPLGMPRSEPDLRELAKALFGEDPMLAAFKPTLDPRAFHDPILGEMTVTQMIESELWQLKKRLGLPAGDRRAGRVN